MLLDPSNYISIYGDNAKMYQSIRGFYTLATSASGRCGMLEQLRPTLIAGLVIGVNHSLGEG